MYILIIDQGTSSTRAILFDLNGKLINQYSVHLTQYYPNQGWVEHCPEEIWQHTLSVLKKITDGVSPKKILACGITNQRETIVCWDRSTGRCLSKAIVWQDRRTQSICDSIIDIDHIIQQKTGLKCDPYFSASKIKWLIDYHQIKPHQYKNIAFGTIDSFLLWRLTGGKSHKTDITNASRTLLFNIHELKWDLELLNLFGVPEETLPHVCDSDSNFGMMNSNIIGFSLPILSVIGDQQAALIGIGATKNSSMKVTYGTGGFVMLNTGQIPLYSESGLLTTIAYKIRNKICYALEGSIYDAGSLMYWLKHNVNLINNYEELETLASSVESTEGVYFIPSFSGLGAPHWITHQGAFFTNISRTTNKSHLVRAVQESVAYQTQDIIKIIQNNLNIYPMNLSVDGGMIKNKWFIQFLSDLTQIKINLPNTCENTAKGAALVAALAYYKNIKMDELSNSWQQYEYIYPSKNKLDEIHYQTWLHELDKLK